MKDCDCPICVDKRKEAKLTALRTRLSKMEGALRSIAVNTCCDKCQEAALAARAALASAKDGTRTFRLGDRVTKTKGSKWTGRVVGTYSTSLTPEGYAVESETEVGSVQIYPVAALASAGENATVAPSQDEIAWLIEADASVHATPHWWGRAADGDSLLGWTPDHSKAMRFARREDAQLYIDDIGWTAARPTEHVWCGPREPIPPTGEAQS